jgi:hypothetical protein
MAREPVASIKLNTIRNYINLIGGFLNKVRIKDYNPRTNTYTDIVPLVRYATTNKVLYRVNASSSKFNLALETQNDIWKYPIILFKLNGMSYDVNRLSVSGLQITGDKYTNNALNSSTGLVKSLIPIDYNFSIEMHSNVYSHLLDFIENFVVYFNPANTYTVTLRIQSH